MYCGNTPSWCCVYTAELRLMTLIHHRTVIFYVLSVLPCINPWSPTPSLIGGPAELGFKLLASCSSLYPAEEVLVPLTVARSKPSIIQTMFSKKKSFSVALTVSESFYQASSTHRHACIIHTENICMSLFISYHCLVLLWRLISVLETTLCVLRYHERKHKTEKVLTVLPSYSHVINTTSIIVDLCYAAAPVSRP